MNPHIIPKEAPYVKLRQFVNAGILGSLHSIPMLLKSEKIRGLSGRIPIFSRVMLKSS